MQFIHLFFVATFFVCPVVAVFLAMRYRRRRSLQRLRLTGLAGACIGILVCVSYAFALQGRLIFTQVLLTSYLATSLMLLLQGLDRFLWGISRAIFGIDRNDGFGTMGFCSGIFRISFSGSAGFLRGDSLCAVDGNDLSATGDVQG